MKGEAKNNVCGKWQLLNERLLVLFHSRVKGERGMRY
jgi:hypothetical protein